MLCYHCMNEKGSAEVCPYCGVAQIPAPQPHHLTPGTVIGGRYTVGRVLGEGGFGITYIGRDNTLEAPVAIKEYYPYGYAHRNSTVSCTVSVSAGDRSGFYDKGKNRFLMEAKNIAKFLNEPGIVDVRDFFEENNTAYIVMEYLDGIDLRAYLKQNGVMRPDRAVNLLLPVMRSLDKVHKVGIIHRDISPDNIMMLKDGQVKLMDFGAARDYDGDNRSMSVTLKQGYAPEEQYRRSGEQGPWTDVYGICATLYRCITGQAPVDALDRTRNDTLTPPSRMGITINPALEQALMRGLSVYRENRYSDMNGLISDLQKGLLPVAQPVPSYDQQAASVARPVSQAEMRTVQVQQALNTQSNSAPQSDQKKNKKLVILLIVIIVLFIAGVIALILILTGGNSGKDTSSSSVSSAFSVAETRASSQTERSEPTSAPRATQSSSSNDDNTMVSKAKANSTEQIATRYNDAIDYVNQYVDLNDYNLQMDSSTGLGYEADGSSYKCTWRNKNYKQPDLPLTVTVEDVDLTLGKTTVKELLDSGFEKVEPNSDYWNEIPFMGDVKKNNQRLALRGNKNASSVESSVLNHIFFYGNDDSLTHSDGSESAQFDFNGLTRDDDLKKAASIFGEPETVWVYSAERGKHAAIHMEYSFGNKQVTLSYWYDDNGGSFLNSVSMDVD